MRNAIIAALGAALLSACGAPAENTAVDDAEATEERNKETALAFYEDLWFTNNTGTYADYVADEYVVHDVGDRKGVTEPAVEQKNIADLFHGFGDLTGQVDWQMADGDMVATRWLISLEASDEAEAMGMTSFADIPIINVFRFNDEGKIVEIWNHRHDVDLPRPSGPPPGSPGEM